MPHKESLEAAETAYLDWAEELYQQALAFDVEDPFPRNGLAEVLKARDDLEGAERLYRETITRWPENVVARNGLAEVLKARVF